jgi:hypothetical protein
MQQAISGERTMRSPLTADKWELAAMKLALELAGTDGNSHV